ncbi:hypothetical protein BKA64DRAFT_2713 [Cadophora sp. MPI-SDFR-AT-0126]|nr:hypothetical protein BKA64DRAFT_2713 [Leotiomycetes sp. MPI-SDFR-AT-0126]
MSDLSPQSNSTIEIDVDGDMYIQAFEYIKVEPHTITLIRVSSKALRGNSDFFDAHIEKFGMDKPLGLHHISVTALKLWLQIFHRTLDADEVFNLSMFDFEHAIRICHQYEFKLSKMSVWFSIWLGSQYLRECDPDDLRRLLSMSNELGHNKASELLNILITEVESGLDEPAISTAFKCYPPVPIMSTRQNSILIFLLEVVPVQDYERWGFSEPFKSIYGEPLEYYSDFYRLMTTTFDQRVVPQLKSFASLGADELSGRFLWFCQMSDDIARTRSLPMLKRREMEAAWVWIAFDFYEKDSTIDPVALKKVITQVNHTCCSLAIALLTTFSEFTPESKWRRTVSIE